MAIQADYTLDVTTLNNNFVGSVTSDNTSWSMGSSGSYHLHNYYYCSHCSPWYTTWTYPLTPQKVYMYQIECPKCATKTFGELDTVVTCKNCKSTIKLVSKVTDYEVAVDL